ncbi:MAG: YifB family Mg chelatase-like AAA ATPase [Oscillospiraceae bacterium]|nr:YifB family Mg chelatase-like AAA ATPase [Oscillospiraceae bacterium]
MYARIRSLGIKGIGGYEVELEVSISNGLPRLDIVGLPDAAVKEAGDRVRAAVKQNGYDFPVSRITVNLAPADTKKAGTVYDLPVLLGILAASRQIPPPGEDDMFFGELSLTGQLRPVPGALPMALAAKQAGARRLFLPAMNAPEAAFAQGLEVYPVENVRQLHEHLSGRAQITPLAPRDILPSAGPGPDFAEVKGQENVKRALEVATAGGHNVLMVGPPGAVKSMLAKRLPGILPDMSRAEALGTTAIWSVAGLTSQAEPVISRRPFRAPNQTASRQALGGGADLKPGEMSLAHNGVLFLDELPEFHRDVIELLRQPLEEGEITVSRASGSVTYPSRFMLVCAMNPCRCGWYGHPSGRCRCSAKSVQAYQAKVSGPLLDRIDITVEVPALEFEELEARPDGESSAAIRERVNTARAIQRRRFAGAGFEENARMTPAAMEQFCTLDEAGSGLMRSAFDALGLTARSYDRILRVARTIADLDNSEAIQPQHLAEAIQYRTFQFAAAQ